MLNKSWSRFRVPAFGHAFGRAERGSITIIFAGTLMTLMAVTAGTVDYVSALRMKSRLQTMVDGVAMSAAKELSLSNSNAADLNATIDGMVKAHFDAMRDTAYAAPTVTTKVSKSPLQVDIEAHQAVDLPFGGMFGVKLSQVSARAVAQVIGRPNICVLALNPSASGTIDLDQQAYVTGENCAVFSNSTSSNGITAKNSATLSASTICSAGGVQGNKANYNPPPYLDCPQFDDPLAGRVEPLVGTCSGTQPTTITASTTLAPGTYCGLEITNGAEVTFAKGTYVFKGKPFVINGGASVKGTDVTLFFSDGATFDFQPDSSVSLEAPTTGPMAGLLIFTGRSSDGRHQICSENAQVMVGTIYGPKGELRIDGQAQIGGASAYTAIVVDKLTVLGGPHVKLNTNYDATDVPVPDGIRGSGQPVRMIN